MQCKLPKDAYTLAANKTWFITTHRLYIELIVSQTRATPRRGHIQVLTGLGFCQDKKHFCQDSGKMIKSSNYRQKLAKCSVHEIA